MARHILKVIAVEGNAVYPYPLRGYIEESANVNAERILKGNRKGKETIEGEGYYNDDLIIVKL